MSSTEISPVVKVIYGGDEDVKVYGNKDCAIVHSIPEKVSLVVSLSTETGVTGSIFPRYWALNDWTSVEEILGQNSEGCEFFEVTDCYSPTHIKAMETYYEYLKETQSQKPFYFERVKISLDDPHVGIDIPEEKYDDFSKILDKYKKDKSDHMGMFSTSILAVTAQAGGALLSNAFGNPKSNHKWALDVVEVSMVVGFGLTLGGIGLRRMKPMLSGVMIKAGAIATASAFIGSMAMPLWPAVAWTIGPVAVGVVAISVVMA